MNRWSKVVLKRPLGIIGVGILVTALAGFWGLGAFDKLSGGGFEDDNSSSAKAAEIMTQEFPDKRVDLIALITTSSGSIEDPQANAAIKREIDKITATSGVEQVTSIFSAPAPQLISRDKRQTYALISLENEAPHGEIFEKLNSQTPESPRLKIQYGGPLAVDEQMNQQTADDLAKAEMISFPILAILLLIIFRSAVAAGVPLILGGLSILVAFLLVRVLTLFTDVSVYAINIITLLGLGLAIDYSLFIVSRFREELSNGKTTDEALTKTLSTAGRTVIFSGLTVMLCLLGLLVFEQNFLRSMGLGGAAAVAATVLLSLTVLPAVLRLLGPRINAWGLPGLRRTLTSPRDTGVWYRYSRLVMRYPLITLGVALELLVILGLPFLSAKFSTPDVSAVPETFSSRQVDTQLRQNFEGAAEAPINVVARRTDRASNQALSTYIEQLKQVSGVSSVTVAGQSSTYTDIRVVQVHEAQSMSAREVLRDIRAIPPPLGWQVETGGETATFEDLLTSLQAKLPWAALVIVLATSILLFLMLGSVVIPLKAIILNVLSLAAAFGLLVWVFQDGHGADFFGLVSNGTIDATQPILIFAIAFGLAMDYELFLLSRVKEEYDRTGDNTQSVAHGIQRTAGIITSAALVLVVVIGLFATGEISLIQQVGVGLAVAVAVDATLVRMVLVPASMRILGRYNWWAPRPLRRLVNRLGVGESV